jgi:putative addiction module component (TIGR02574 family)
MSKTAEQVLEDAMALTEDERAELAVRLHASVSDRPDRVLEDIWDQEISDRLKAIDDGSEELIPAEEVHRELRQKYGFFKG